MKLEVAGAAQRPVSLTAISSIHTLAPKAAMAKAAGFEWVNEEGSWEEDGRKGGFKPRALSAWEWTMGELAAFTAVRQVLLVSDEHFDPSATLTRLKGLSPPLLQKAYRVLLSLRQVNILEKAWTANDFRVEDCVDHEVGFCGRGRQGVNRALRVLSLYFSGDHVQSFLEVTAIQRF